MLATRSATVSSTRDFAEQVLDGLGGDRRVIVFEPATSASRRASIRRARSSRPRAGRHRRRQHLDSFADGAQAAAGVLDASDATSAPSATEDDGRDSFPSGSFFCSSRRRGGRSRRRLGASSVLARRRGRRRWCGRAGRGGEGARGDRPHLASRARPRRPPEGRRAGGGRAAVRGGLGRLPRPPGRPRGGRHPLGARGRVAPDRRRGLEARVGGGAARGPARAPRARRRRAVPAAGGSVPPAAPGQAPATPGPVPGPASSPPPVQDRGYRGFDVSPWLTQAAIAAVTMLASRRGRSTPQHREPMGGDVFGDIFGGLGPGSSWGGGGSGGGSSQPRGRPRIRIGGRGGGGGRGRGMGRRR